MENGSWRGPLLRRVFSGRPEQGSLPCSDGAWIEAPLTRLETSAPLIGSMPDPIFPATLFHASDHLDSVVAISRLHAG